MIIHFITIRIFLIKKKQQQLKTPNPHSFECGFALSSKNNCVELFHQFADEEFAAIDVFEFDVVASSA